MEPTGLAAEFIAYCLQQHPARWPEIYDQMCWVAGRRLFRGLGYAELSRAGLSLSLTQMAQLRRMVEQVSAQGSVCS